MTHSVSVVIPNYNRASLIGATLENMLAQSLPPLEIIVVDDGSSDASLDVIASFGAKVRLIRQSHLGPGAARNAGLREARGEYVQFMDSDDLSSLNKLAAQSQALHQAGADIAYGPWIKARIDGNTVRFEGGVIQDRPLPSHSNVSRQMLEGWVIVFQACMFRREFLRRAGFYRTDLCPSEDTEFLFRMQFLGPKWVFVPDTLLVYRLHGMQITENGTTQSRRAVDWANCIYLMGQRQVEAGAAPIPLQFKLMNWRALRGIKTSGNEGAFFEQNKMSRIASGPSFFYQLLDTAEWVRSRLRSHLTGTSYKSAYGASDPRGTHLNLIRNMGFEPLGVPVPAKEMKDGQ